MIITFLDNGIIKMDREKILEWLQNKDIKAERLMHLLGAEKMAKELAKRFGADEQRASIAALLHDCAKPLPVKKLLKLIEENNIDVTQMELDSEKTLHAPASAFLAQKELGIEDTEILEAIRYHTIGRKEMTLMDKIIFLSDKAEHLTRDEDFRKKVWRIIDKTNNLDEAILLCYDKTIRSLMDRKLVINPETIEVYNHLLIKLKNNS